MTDKAAEKQEFEADVVVVGYGGAGATAAIAAHDSGARVVILEKLPAGGGNTAVSGGAIFTPISMEAIQYVEGLCFRTTEREILQTFVENALETKDWIHEIGGETVHQPHLGVTYPPHPDRPSFPNVAGSKHTTTLVVQGSQSESPCQRLWKLLSGNVERRGVRVMSSTPAKELVTNQKGEVTGVVVETNGEKVVVKAKRAVILTCGGFEYNEAMKAAFLPLEPFHAFGSPGNTGDGIVMVQAVGAALWHMKVVEGYLGFKAPEYQATFSTRFHSERFIYVNSQGRRFCNETALEHHDGWRAFSLVDSRWDTAGPCYPNIPVYSIFDEVTRRKGPLFLGNSGFNRDYYKWSLDNSKELAKGWITQAKTIGELARRVSIDGSSLENTITRYNEYCKAGKDADFGRYREDIGPIETPPFYAIELWPSLVNTQGGPRRDKQARVLNHEGKPIPRLYAAGELGSIWGFLYNSGGNIAECLAFGRIAGRNAAAEKPRS